MCNRTFNISVMGDGNILSSVHGTSRVGLSGAAGFLHTYLNTAGDPAMLADK